MPLFAVVLHVERSVQHREVKVLLLERSNLRLVNERQSNIIQPVQQTFPPERVNLERITQAHIVRNDLLLQVNRHAVTFVLLSRA